MRLNSSKRLTASSYKSEQVLNLLLKNVIPAGFTLASKAIASNNTDIAGAILVSHIDGIMINPVTGTTPIKAKHVIIRIKSKLEQLLLKYAEVLDYDQDLEHYSTLTSLPNNAYRLDFVYNDISYIEITTQNISSFGVCITIRLAVNYQ